MDTAEVSVKSPAGDDAPREIPVPGSTAGKWRRIRTAFRSRWAGIALAGLLLAMGFAARIYRIDSETLWYDENFNYGSLCRAASFAEFFNDDWNLLINRISPYFIAQYFWAHWMSKEILSLRLLSVVFSMAALFSLYAFTKRMYGFTAGACALLMACLSNIHIYYAQEVREYSLLLLLSIWSMDSFHRAWHGGRRSWFIIHYIVSCLILFTHLFGGFLLAAQGLYLLILYRREIWRVILWAAVYVPVILGMAWWISTADFGRLDVGNSWIPQPGIQGLLRGMTWDGAYLPHALFRGELGLAALCWALWMVWRDTNNSTKKNDENAPGTGRKDFLLLSCWLIVPPAGLFLLYCFYGPCFVLRYVLYSSCALFILFGAALSSIRSTSLRNAAIAGLAALMLWHCISEPRPFRPDHRACAEIIRTHRAPDDLVLKYPNLGIQYFQLFWPELGADAEGLDTYPKLVARVWEEARKGKDIWVIISLQGEDKEMNTFDRSLRDRHLAFERFPVAGGSPTYVYMGLARNTLRHYYSTAVYHIREDTGGASSVTSSTWRGGGPSDGTRRTHARTLNNTRPARINAGTSRPTWTRREKTDS